MMEFSLLCWEQIYIIFIVINTNMLIRYLGWYLLCVFEIYCLENEIYFTMVAYVHVA